MNKEDEEHFDDWWSELMHNRQLDAYGCFMRDVLRGCKLDLYGEYVRLCGGGKPRHEKISQARKNWSEK